MTSTFCSALASSIVNYISLKQVLGRKFATETRVLASLDRYLQIHGPVSAVLTPELFASWCLTLAHLSPTIRRNRMRIVRNFCLYVRRTEPTCFVPDLATFPTPQPAQRPHIFSEDEIVRLLRVATGLPPRSRSPLRSQSYRLAVVLLYTAGLRRGELVRLVLSDYDPVECVLLIRASKFHKSRLVALSPDAAREIETFLVARRQLPHNSESPLLVSSCHGLRARSGGGFGQSMRQLFIMAGIQTASGHPPRVHDLRHTHAVHALLRWYQAGVNVQAKLPVLATSMGHVSVVSTAYYLSLLAPVAQAASDLFADHCAAIIQRPPMTRGDR